MKGTKTSHVSSTSYFNW